MCSDRMSIYTSDRVSACGYVLYVGRVAGADPGRGGGGGKGALPPPPFSGGNQTQQKNDRNRTTKQDTGKNVPQNILNTLKFSKKNLVS